MARITKAEQAIIDAENIKAAQQAELKRLRAEKARAKREAVKAAAQVVEAQHVVIEDKAFSAVDEDTTRREQIASIVNMIMDGIELPSWKRVVCAVALSVLISAGAGYLIGAVGAALILGAMTLGVGAWIAFVIWALSLAFSVYAGLKIGQHVGNYVLSGQVDRDIDRVCNAVSSSVGGAKDAVFGWFKPKAVLA